MNPLIQGKSGTTPVMSRNAFSTNQGTNEDDSQSDPHPEAGIFGNQMMRNSGQKDRRDMVTGVTEQTRNGQKDRHDMVTGVTEQTHNGQKDRRDLVTGVTEQTRNGQIDRRDMVTGVTEQTRNQRDIITGVQRERVFAATIR